MAGHRLSFRDRQAKSGLAWAGSVRDRQAMSALTTSSQIWLTALQTAAHQVRQVAGLPVRVQQMAVQQELQIMLHSHSNRYVVR